MSNNDKERLTKALDSLIFLPHLKDRQDRSSLSSLVPVEGAPGGKGRSWDKGDLFRRLQTFKSSTWFAKPDSISPVECVRRGWKNTGLDLLTCEFCNAVVSCPIAPQLLPKEAAAAGARYAQKLVEGHDSACPWRHTCCSLSLLEFPRAPQGAVLANFKERTEALNRITCLPPIDKAAVQEVAAGHEMALADFLVNGLSTLETSSNKLTTSTVVTRASKPALDKSPSEILAALSDGSAVNSTTATDTTSHASTLLDARVRFLGLLGWDLRPVTASGDKTTITNGTSINKPQNTLLPPHIGPESSSLLCTMCGARAGLWTFFPDLEPKAVLQSDFTKQPGLGNTTSIAIAGGQKEIGRGGNRNIPHNNNNGLTRQLSRQVAIEISTTIAGGDLRSGTQHTRQADNDQGDDTNANASAAPFGRSSFDGTGGGGSDELPAFGFAALRSPQSGGNGGKLASPSAAHANSLAKRMRDPFWDSILHADSNKNNTAGDGNKRAKTGNDTDNTTSKSAATEMLMNKAPTQPPSPATLRRYKALQANPLNPITLHRSYCPWVTTPKAPFAADKSTEDGERTEPTATATGNSSREDTCEAAGSSQHCGWRWLTKQLVLDTEAQAAVGGGEEDDRARAQWDPASTLRNILHKLDVRK